MTDGLEISEARYSSVFAEQRLDSEYVLKAYLAAQKALEKTHVRPIGDFAYVTDGIHESIDFDESSEINLISAKAPKQNYFDLSSSGHISKEQHSENPRTQLVKNDVIVSTVGTIGNCAVVNEHILPANADRHVGIIRILDSEIKPRYLSTFLLTKYGRYQTKRFITGNVQPNLFLYKIKQIKVPIFSAKFQNTIEETVAHSDRLLQQSAVAMRRAEEVLTNALGVTNSENEPQTVKALSESFRRSGRLDAEYYQPKYDHITKALNAPENVISLCKPCDAQFEPDPMQLYDYIELANVEAEGQISDVEKIEGYALPSRARRRVKTGQVIVSSVEGSLGSCALIDEEYDEALCSTGFFVIESEKINPETLLVLFKSEPIQLLMKQRCSGTILTAISKDEFLNMPLPLVDDATQSQIKKNVQEALHLRKEAITLLGRARRTVEAAIETDEETALINLRSP